MTAERYRCEKFWRRANEEEIRGESDLKKDINELDNDGWTLLHWAAAYNSNPPVLRLLMQEGARVDIRSDRGNTPIHLAAKYNKNIEVLKLLIKKEKSLFKSPNKAGATLLHLAAGYNIYPVVQFLLGEGADITEKTNGGATPLHFAAGYNGDSEILNLLLNQNPVSINAKDNDGWTPLHWAANINMAPEIADFLLDKGADIEAQADSLLTPLHIAVIHCNPSAVESLLKRNASIKMKDSEGKTPLHYAEHNHCNPQTATQIMKLLLDYDVKSKSQNNSI